MPDSVHRALANIHCDVQFQTQLLLLGTGFLQFVENAHEL
jgi:hypothetical protein